LRISGITFVPRKTHKTRNTIILITLLVLLVMISIMSISIYDAWTITHPEKIITPTATSNIVPEKKAITFKDINKSETLSGWYFEVKGSVKTIILAHQYGKNKLQFDSLSFNMIKDFNNKGYNVFTFDFRGSGSSSGKLTTFGLKEKDDLLGAVSYIKSQGAENITLMGFYTGASTCIMAAADDKYSADINAVIADSAYSDLNEYLNDILPQWTGLPSIPFNKTILLSMKLINGIDPFKASPKSVIEKISPKPILFIHSKKDTEISINNSIELYNIYSKVAAKNTEFWQTNDAENIDSYVKHPTEYMQKVFDFLDNTSKNK
jgi:uncharacterized protein